MQAIKIVKEAADTRILTINGGSSSIRYALIGAGESLQLNDKLVEYKLYIDVNGEDMPEIRNWKWVDSR